MGLKIGALGAALIAAVFSLTACKTAGQQAAAPAPAAEDAAAKVAAAEPAAAPVENGDQVICKVTEETGSRVKKKRVCKTKSEWAADEEAAKKFLSNSNRRATQPGGEAIMPGG